MTEGWLADFQQNGWVKPGICLEPSTLEALRAAVDRLVEQSRSVMGLSLEEWARRVSQFRHPERSEPAFARLKEDPRFLAMGEEILGEPVGVWEVHLVLKSPTTVLQVPYHQDWPTWKLPEGEERAVALWVSLDDVDEEAGALRYLPGSHRLKEELDSVLVPVPAGEVLIHHARVWHASGNNRSGHWRRACILVLAARELCGVTPR